MKVDFLSITRLSHASFTISLSRQAQIHPSLFKTSKEPEHKNKTLFTLQHKVKHLFLTQQDLWQDCRNRGTSSLRLTLKASFLTSDLISIVTEL